MYRRARSASCSSGRCCRWTTTQGYFGMPERTLEAFRNLWFHTGDAARLDADGNLWFVDRLKDRIRRRGENIASADVETVLIEHPAIADAAVSPSRPTRRAARTRSRPSSSPRPAPRSTRPVWAWCDETAPLLRRPALRRDPAASCRRRRPRRCARASSERRASPRWTNDRGPARRAVAAASRLDAASAPAPPPRRRRPRRGSPYTIASTSSASVAPAARAARGVDLDERRLVLGRVDRTEQQLDQLRLERPLAQHATVEQRIALECSRRAASRGAPPARGSRRSSSRKCARCLVGVERLARVPASGWPVVREDRRDEPAGRLVAAARARARRRQPRRAPPAHRLRAGATPVRSSPACPLAAAAAAVNSAFIPAGERPVALGRAADTGETLARRQARRRQARGGATSAASGIGAGAR